MSNCIYDNCDASAVEDSGLCEEHIDKVVMGEGPGKERLDLIAHIREQIKSNPEGYANDAKLTHVAALVLTNLREGAPPERENWEGEDEWGLLTVSCTNCHRHHVQDSRLEIKSCTCGQQASALVVVAANGAPGRLISGTYWMKA